MYGLICQFKLVKHEKYFYWILQNFTGVRKFYGTKCLTSPKVEKFYAILGEFQQILQDLYENANIYSKRSYGMFCKICRKRFTKCLQMFLSYSFYATNL